MKGATPATIVIFTTLDVQYLILKVPTTFNFLF